jgi:hypothetical protein
MSGVIEGNELTEEIIRENLSCLGRHPFYSRHAYLGLRATDLGLNSVERISQFPHLMFVNVAGNKIENLTPLENLIGLVQLNAR